MKIKMEKVESSPLNPKEKKGQKIACIDEYYSYKSKKKEILTTTSLERICDELVEWATKEDDAIKINQFLALKGIPYGTWHNWIEKNEILRNAVAHAKMIIGNRREYGAMTRKFEAGNTMYVMSLYDPDWEKMLRLRAEIADKKEDNKGVIFVAVPAIPNTEVVPVKEDDGK